MIEPLSEALTTSIRPAWSAKAPISSSAPLPKVALSRPPSPGPEPQRQLLGRLADQAGQRDDRQRPR